MTAGSTVDGMHPASAAPDVSTTSGQLAGDRPISLRLARVHLRMGSLGLARAELEAFAGRGELDEEALLDLTEVRWRTGDLAGAGEVANAYLASGRRHPLALVVAAEAVAALGRPGEARRLAGAALDSIEGSLDPIFAGMPRSLIWPSEAADAGPSAAITTARPPGPAGILSALPEPEAELDAGRSALASGDHARAAVRFGVAIRLSPALAPAVLEQLRTAVDPHLLLVRGDAFRAVGREAEARRSYAEALRALARPAAGDRR